MNRRIILYFLGWVLKLEAIFMLIPIATALIYREESGKYFLIVAGVCLLLGITFKKPKNSSFYVREGFVAVALSWIVLSVFGALPFFLSGEIPNFEDALFETISGFTTTGASILTDVEAMSKCMLLWRNFTHWIGGMGVLVFVLAILPMTGAYNIHIMRAESPGPSVGKLVPKVKSTAKILYGIYIVMTLIQIVLLIAGGMPVFDALTISFGTAGTGGFGIKNDSIASYSLYHQIVTTIFMILFGVNFNVYFLLLEKKPKEAFKCEEMRVYFGIILVSIILIAIDIQSGFSSIGHSFQQSAFQVASIITTTGFSTVDFNMWPTFSKAILVILMFIGACAGSTGGGLKVSRVVIAFKTVSKEMSSMIHPRSVKILKMEGKNIEHSVLRSVNTYVMTYALVFVLSALVVSLDKFDLVSTFTAVAATFNNIGPGLELVGPASNFSAFSPLSKYVLMFDMLAGRLELFPMLLLFSLRTWRKQL